VHSLPEELGIMSQNILIVDDEPSIRQMLGFTLSGDGYRYLEAGDAEEAQARIEENELALILLDWMLPGVSGVDFARKLKREPRTQGIPIIMLTARGEEADKVKGFEVGADDYVTKPFSTKELLARVKAVLRRAAQQPAPVEPTSGLTLPAFLECKGLRLDLETHRVSADGVELDLSPTEFRLLHFFFTHPERVYTRSQLLDRVWGDNVYIEERTVDVHIRRLRKILQPHGYDGMLQTVRSVGYRFSAQ
jgi:two-component system, OmpR family, phosphate regulon response regulator PhoB